MIPRLVGRPAPGARGWILRVLNIDKVLLWIERQRITQAPSEAKAPLVIEGSDQDDRVLPQFGERARRPLADDDSLAAGLQRAEHPSHRHGIGERNRRC